MKIIVCISNYNDVVHINKYAMRASVHIHSIINECDHTSVQIH